MTAERLLCTAIQTNGIELSSAPTCLGDLQGSHSAAVICACFHGRSIIGSGQPQDNLNLLYELHSGQAGGAGAEGGLQALQPPRSGPAGVHCRAQQQCLHDEEGVSDS